MKKGLSILLIAAALFGFYGGAVNLNDVLACKDYWEVKGEETTADMNKLEDGLNQLKENEEAYLDGIDAVADGEEALAKGEAEYEEGQATLAQGEADYAAAPAKLADAERQIAKGESDLADGAAKLAAAKKQLTKGESDLADGEKKLEKGYKDYKQGKKDYKSGKKQLKGLSALIDGINQINKGYKNDWKTGYKKLKDGREQIYKGSKGSIKDLTALAAFLPEKSQKAYVAAVKDVAADDEKQSADDYKDFIENTNKMADALPEIQKAVKKAAAGAQQLLAALDGAKGSNLQFAGTVNQLQGKLTDLAAFISDKGQREQYVEGIKTVSKAYDDLEPTIEQNYEDYLASDEGKQVLAYQVSQNMDTGWAQFFASDDGKAAIAGAKKKIAAAYSIPEEDVTDDQAKEAVKGDDDAKAGVTAAVTKNVKAGIKDNVEKKVKAGYESNEKLTGGKNALIAALTKISAGLDEVNEKVNGDDSAISNKLLPGLKKFNKATSGSPVDQLSEGQDTIEDGVRQIAKGALSSDTLRKEIKKKMGASAVTLLSTYKSKPSPLSTKASDFGEFYDQMEKTPGLVATLTKANGLLRKAKAEGKNSLNEGRSALADARNQLSKGENDLKDGKAKLAAGKKEYAKGLSDYAAGKAKLADGKRQYAQGLADYKAAPAKLAEGRAQLAEGLQKLMDGRKELADGKAKLAEYEDGEAQIRDGLATLMGTAPDGGLTSILDRRSGDDDFDNGDEHLEIDEGLEAVEVGRGYQADSGELITKEITNRAVGTAAGLGAGALAVLAAILSFLKKNKGAGVCALLSAAAGAAGIGIGTSAGMEFSNIAGSTVTAMPWIACGVLAAVALVHAIAHFAGSKAA